MRTMLLPAAATLGFLVILTPRAESALFTASGVNGETGTSLSASVAFTIDSSGLLRMTLANTGANAVAPSDVLTCVFFHFDGILSPVSASLEGSTILHGATPWDGNVGGEWGYAAGLKGAPGDATQGVSAAGLGLFGHANFGGEALFTPPPGLQLGGLDAGLVSSLQTDVGSNQKILKMPLIQDHVVFTFTGMLPAGFDPALDIRNVSFQYGTDLRLTNLPGQLLLPPPPALVLIPEPGARTVWGLICSALAAGTCARVLRRKNAERALPAAG